MASYETEHNVNDPKQATGQRRRPDLGTFFSNLEQVDTSQTQNSNALPIPAMMSAVFRTGLEGMQEIMETNPNQELPEQILDFLRSSMEAPPKEIKGVSDQFLTDLERIPKKSLKKTDDCPICGIPFLDDEYPLVVRLPCNKNHLFDLDCIQPWLKLNPTCPLDRKDFMKKKTPPPPAKEEEEEEEYDDMYA